MTRTGAALFVALIVVLMGGLIAVVATMVAAVEIRAGSTWGEQQRASGLGAGAFARALPSLETEFDSLSPGGSFALDDTVSLTRLTDSLALVRVAARSRLGEDVYVSIANAATDSTGARRLRMPPRGRARFHPIP